MSSTTFTVNIGIIGCGNIMQSVHFPALYGQSGCTVRWLVDTNATNLKQAALWYPDAQLTADIEDVEGIDAVFIATPPALHYEQVKGALMKGWHVFVEKPLTIDFEASQELVALAAQRNRILCVNLNRRFFSNVRALKELLRTNPFGRITSIKIMDGGRWIGGADGGATFHSSLRLSGGGVMLDTGSHMIDLAARFLNAPVVRSVEYADDSAIGLEAECRFSLAVGTGNGDVTLHGFFSRIAPVQQRCEIQCERATIKVDLPSGDIEVSHLDGTETVLSIPVPRQHDPAMVSFRESVKEFLKGCRDTQYHPDHSAQSTLFSLEAIQRCYREKKALPNPWGEVIKEKAALQHDTHASKKVVGIIGAGGFLGSRLFERLLCDGRYAPRAITHSSLGSFATLRHTDAVCIGDATSVDFLKKALTDVDVVVNCAMNMKGARKFAIHETRTIARIAARVAAAMGVQRLIQISTIAVHGIFLGKREQPLSMDPLRSTYSLAKMYSEQDVQRVSNKSKLDAVILRMGHIYGPYSVGWTVGQRDLIRSGKMMSVDGWRNPSNTVFVDNAIDAIIAAIEHPTPLKGEMFYITDVPNKSWREFYEPFFARERGNMDQVPDMPIADVMRAMKENQKNVVSQGVDFFREMVRPIFKKDHLRALKEKRKYQKLFNGLESVLSENIFRSSKRWLNRRAFVSSERESTRVLEGIYYDMACSYASSIEIPVSRATSLLGYRPSVDWKCAQRITMDWLTSIE